MSQPELPNLPPPPRPSLRERIWRLFTRPKLPGWAFFLLLVIQWVPDWKARFDFWVEAAEGVGGYTGAFAAMIGSPYFSLVMAGAGVLWLAFAGEPSRGVLRDARWRYLGWAIFAACFIVVVTVVGRGALEAYVLDRTFWHLTASEASRLGRELDQVPEEQRFPISVRTVMSNAQALTFADDLLSVFHQHGWVVTGAQDPTLRADLQGINFVTALDYPRRDKDAPPHMMELGLIFHRAGFKVFQGWEPRTTNNSTVVSLAIGSRPSNW